MIKVALLADIHANFPALLAATEQIQRWKPDAVYVLGDSINRGPRPRECLHHLVKMRREKHWKLIYGNHEDYVLQFESEDAPRPGPRFEILQFVHWTYQKLSREEIQTLRSLPAQIEEHLSTGQLLRAVHASMAGIRAGIYPHTPQEKIREMIQPAPDIFCVGHTHKPLTRQIGQTHVINAGSVGLPFDGNPQPSYAQIYTTLDEVNVEICRFDYDRSQALKDFHETHFLDEGGPIVKIIYQELLSAKPLINRWSQTYEEKVLNGECTVEESVKAFLKDNPNPHLATDLKK